MEVLTLRLSQGEHALLAALDGGHTLAEAAEAAMAAEPDLDLMAALARHLTSGSFAAAR